MYVTEDKYREYIENVKKLYHPKIKSNKNKQNSWMDITLHK